MPLPHDFEKTLTEKTDEQLYDMLAHADDYLPDALAAARSEIQRRNLDPNRVTQLEARAEAVHAQELHAADEPLQWPVRLVMSLLPLGVIQIVVAQSYRDRGYKRKQMECWEWMGYGVVFWFVFIFLTHLTRLGEQNPLEDLATTSNCGFLKN